MDKLQAYRDKRDASRTPEPVPAPGPAQPGSGATFVIQEHHARRLHWDFRLERDGVLVSWALPKGVPNDPAVNHLAVHTEDHPLDYGHFQGQIPRGEYGAGAVTIWDHGTYETQKWSASEVKVVLHGERVTGGYVLFQTKGNQWMIHRERLTLPGSLRPMLALTGVMPRDPENWALEMKWDGVRALAYIEKGKVRLMSRTERDITVTYPELSRLGTATLDKLTSHKQLPSDGPAPAPRKQLLLDGEIVVFGSDGWPEFEALQPRMHVSSASQAALLAGQTPVTYLIFDLLQLDGRPLMDLAYSERRALLDGLALSGPYWQTPPWFPGSDFAAVQAVSIEHGMEGIVAKRLDSRYTPGVRTDNWRKIKNVHTQEAVVAGYKPGQGNRTGQVGSLLIGVNDASGLVYAGHVGTGFTDETLRLLGDKLRPLRRPDSPFDGPVPPEHARPAVWVEPRLVIEVSFDRWTKAGRMRAPVYKGLRDDIDPKDVVREP
ncbi:MAG TPA: non-homologous end-joining DNA ligase [Streptosporangiaceae bacterium]|nr:non-homologous end-joining DNA ligase [Streptosporangiaceae bacterium]